MKTVIYLDVLLAVNFVTAAFLLAGCGAVCGAECRVGRVLAGAGAAAASSLILLAPELPFAVQLAYQAATAAGIVRIAFAWRGVRAFLRQCAWYLLLNLTLAGFVVLAAYRGCDLVQTHNLACYFGLSPMLLFGCVAGVYLFLRLLTFCFGRPDARRLWQMRLWTRNTELCVQAYYDTGFSVQDPLSGRPAVLLYYTAVKAQLSPELCRYLDAYFADNAKKDRLGPNGKSRGAPGDSMRAGEQTNAAGQNTKIPLPPPGLRVCLIECRTVTGACLLPAVPAERCLLREEKVSHCTEDIRIVFTGEAVPDTRCPALFGPELAHKDEWRKKDDDTMDFAQVPQ